MATAELLDEETSVTVVDSSTAMEVSRVEIDTQIATAKRYPRSIKTFKEQALAMATLDEETAASMFYTLPRAGKKIQGPSIRLAEVVGSSYGNLRYGARIVSTEHGFITAQGACHDLEKNISITYEVRRRITNKRGERFNDDMIQTTGNAAMSIALREAIFRVVPRSLFNSIYEQSKLASIGKAKTMSEQRHAAFDWFKKAGATEAQLLAFLDRNGLDDVTIDDIITLRGLVTAIREGETTIEDALAPKKPEPQPTKSLDELAQKLKVNGEKSANTPPTPEAKPVASEIPAWDRYVSEIRECDVIGGLTLIYDRYFGSDSTIEWTAEEDAQARTVRDGRAAELRASRGGKK